MLGCACFQVLLSTAAATYSAPMLFFQPPKLQQRAPDIFVPRSFPGSLEQHAPAPPDRPHVQIPTPSLELSDVGDIVCQGRADLLYRQNLPPNNHPTTTWLPTVFFHEYLRSEQSPRLVPPAPARCTSIRLTASSSRPRPQGLPTFPSHSLRESAAEAIATKLNSTPSSHRFYSSTSPPTASNVGGL